MESGSQEMLGLWASDDPVRLRRLAADIEANDGWQGYLSAGEHLIFKSALDSPNPDLWEKLLSGELKARIESKEVVNAPAAPSSNLTGPTQSPAPGQAGTPAPVPATATPVTTTTTTSVDPVSLAFRIRYMLYDKSLSVLYPSVDPESSLDIGSSVFEDPGQDIEPSKPPARKTDDDYDDDYDDEEDEKKNDVAPAASGPNDSHDASMNGNVDDNLINGMDPI
jgi:transcriptional activator SPT7